MKKNKTIALLAGLSLAFVSSAALAAPSADTLLVAGYDSNQMAVLYGVSGIDQDGDEPATLDCTLVGDFVYELDDEADEEAIKVAVTGLKTKGADGEEDGDVEFFDEDVEEPKEGEGVLYGTDDADECDLTSVTVDRDGKVNHGAVVSTFAKLGKGCIVRHFAQSDFGKADYDAVDSDLFEVTLMSIKTSCDKQKDKDAVSTLDDDASSGGKANAPGQANKADKANKGGGKATAPGQEGK